MPPAASEVLTGIVSVPLLLAKLWTNTTDAQYLRVYVRQLRQKVEADPERPQYILTETGIGYRLHHSGAQAMVKVLTPNAARLDALMPVKAPPDMSKFLLSPMPGLLVSLAVSEGQEIKAGEVLAVVEAMKMENILRASQDGTVAKIHAAPGSSLAVDQKIVEFA